MNKDIDRIKKEILSQLAAAKTVAPREIAQALVEGEEDWRKYLPVIKQVAKTLAVEGMLVFIRKKKIIDPDSVKGIYRFGTPEQ